MYSFFLIFICITTRSLLSQNLSKGNLALVVESHDSFVLIVPKDEFVDLIKGDNFKSIDYEGLADVIYNILKDRISETGGILSFEEVYSILKRTSIQEFIKKKHLMKAIKYKDASFDRITDNGGLYLALKPNDCPNDLLEIMNLSKDRPHITQKIIQQATQWSNLRIKRILNHFDEKGLCRKDSSYLTGERYFF